LIAAHRIASQANFIRQNTRPKTLSLCLSTKEKEEGEEEDNDRSGHRAGIYNVIGIIDALYSVTNYHTQDNKTRRDETLAYSSPPLFDQSPSVQLQSRLLHRSQCNATLGVYIQTTTEEAEEEKNPPE